MFHGEGKILLNGKNMPMLILGSIVAFIVALEAIKFFIDYVSKYGFAAFGWYRIIVGIVIIVLGLLGVDMQIE